MFNKNFLNIKTCKFGMCYGIGDIFLYQSILYYAIKNKIFDKFFIIPFQIYKPNQVSLDYIEFIYTLKQDIFLNIQKNITEHNFKVLINSI